MLRRVIEETHLPLESFLLIRNPGWILPYQYLLGAGQMDRQGGRESLACCLPSNALGGQAAGKCLPTSPINVQYCTGFCQQTAMLPPRQTLAFSAQLLLLLFLINMPELFRHLLLCYLWFVNMMLIVRHQNHTSARAVRAGRKTYWQAKQAGRLEHQAYVAPYWGGRQAR